MDPYAPPPSNPQGKTYGRRQGSHMPPYILVSVRATKRISSSQALPLNCRGYLCLDSLSPASMSEIQTVSHLRTFPQPHRLVCHP